VKEGRKDLVSRGHRGGVLDVVVNQAPLLEKAVETEDKEYR
jgi:hypothetical protein